MTDTASNINQPEPAATEGLDDLFEAEVVPGNTSDLLPGSTVEEASRILGISPKTVKDRLRKGTLQGSKVPGKYGNTWRVDLSSIDDPAPLVAPTCAEVIPGSTTDPLPGTTSADTYSTIDSLIKRIDEKDHLLQAAVYRNGYLEAQLDASQQSSKLLPDLQAKAALVDSKDAEIDRLKAELERYQSTWWIRLTNWFRGQ